MARLLDVVDGPRCSDLSPEDEHVIARELLEETVARLAEAEDRLEEVDHYLDNLDDVKTQADRVEKLAEALEAELSPCDVGERRLIDAVRALLKLIREED